MPVDPKEFFRNYVLAPYEGWIADELCEWKAFAVVNGLNALVDHAVLHYRTQRCPTCGCSVKREAYLWPPGIKVIAEGVAIKRTCLSDCFLVEPFRYSPSSTKRKMLVDLSYRTDVVVVSEGVQSLT